MTALPLYSHVGNTYSRDYFAEFEHGEMPTYNIFSKTGDGIFHRVGCELFSIPPEPDQQPRGIDSIWPLWNLLDLTPDGRGSNWGSEDHDSSLLRYDGG